MDFSDIVDYLADGFDYIIHFEWVSDVGEVFSNGIESLSSIEDSPLSNVWFWVFLICLLAGVWYLPGAFGVMDYKLWEKLMYTILFFIIDWFLVAHFSNS
jgi:hypothetical protein